MIDGIPVGLAGQLSGWALAALCFLLLATGRLVPKGTVEREQRLLERECEAWKQAHDTEAAQLSLIVAELQRGRRGGSRRSPAEPAT